MIYIYIYLYNIVTLYLGVDVVVRHSWLRFCTLFVFRRAVYANTVVTASYGSGRDAFTRMDIGYDLA